MNKRDYRCPHAGSTYLYSEVDQHGNVIPQFQDCGTGGHLCDMCKEDRADARAAMSGLLANGTYREHDPEATAQVSVEHADALLAELAAEPAADPEEGEGGVAD